MDASGTIKYWQYYYIRKTTRNVEMMEWKYRNNRLRLISLYFLLCQPLSSCASTEQMDVQPTDTSDPNAADAIMYWNKQVPNKCLKDKKWLKHHYLDIESWYLLGKLYGMNETVIYAGTNSRKGINYINNSLYAVFPKLRLSKYNFTTPSKLLKELKVINYTNNSELQNKKITLYNPPFKNIIMQGTHINVNAYGVDIVNTFSNKHNIEFYFVSGAELQNNGVCFWKNI